MRPLKSSTNHGRIFLGIMLLLFLAAYSAMGWMSTLFMPSSTANTKDHYERNATPASPLSATTYGRDDETEDAHKSSVIVQHQNATASSGATFNSTNDTTIPGSTLHDGSNKLSQEENSIETLNYTQQSSAPKNNLAGVNSTEQKIVHILRSIVHVTHTHSSSNDTWKAAFDTLEEYGRGPSSSLGHVNIKFVLCTDRMDPALDQWPWLEVVEYSKGTEKLRYPKKVANCLQEVVSRHDPKLVLHVMEDMILTGPIRWELVAAGARILAATPNAAYFRFMCSGGVHNYTCPDLNEEGIKPAAKKTQYKLPSVRDCGGCSAGDYTSVFYTEGYNGVPLLARPQEWIDLHNKHDKLGSDSGSRMETWSYKHRGEFPGPGLQGFIDGTVGVGFVNRTGRVYPAQTTATPHCTPRRFAYPYIHTGVQFGMWKTADHADILCPFMEEQGIVEAGAMDCKTDLNATPPCLCDDVTQCHTKKNGTLRKFWKTGEYEKHHFPNGCASWRELGRPHPPPVSSAGPDVEKALREQGLWEALDLDKAWDNLSSTYNLNGSLPQIMYQ